MDFEINCQFSEPLQVNTGGELVPPTTQNANFQFSKMACSSTDPTITYISDNGKSFYLSQTWDYGTLFLSFLFFLAILFLTAKGVIEFLFDKVVRLKRKERHF